jgi:hypothetical protein
MTGRTHAPADQPPSEPVTVVRRRGCRTEDAPPRTLNVARLSRKRIFEAGAALTEDTRAGRPRTRADCELAPRPCPYVGCRYHLAIEVHENGSIRLNFPDVEIEDMVETCALDVADAGGATLEEVAAYINLTRERVRQLEIVGLRHARVRGVDIEDYAGHDCLHGEHPLSGEDE